MASYHAIAGVGQAILGLLTDACPRTEFPAAGFALYQAGDFRAPMAEGVSLYLHRIGPSVARRRMADRVTPDGRKLMPSLSLDLHYMLTPWAQSTVVQHHLLGWAMRTLEDTPILPAGLLGRASASPATPSSATRRSS